MTFVNSCANTTNVSTWHLVGRLHTAGGVDYFVWNNKLNAPRVSLIRGSMPPFIRGKSKFDNWIVHEVIQAGFRQTVIINRYSYHMYGVCIRYGIQTKNVCAYTIYILIILFVGGWHRGNYSSAR